MFATKTKRLVTVIKLPIKWYVGNRVDTFYCSNFTKSNRLPDDQYEIDQGMEHSTEGKVDGVKIVSSPPPSSKTTCWSILPRWLAYNGQNHSFQGGVGTWKSLDRYICIHASSIFCTDRESLHKEIFRCWSIKTIYQPEINWLHVCRL